jgi:hypothetical protein
MDTSMRIMRRFWAAAAVAASVAVTGFAGAGAASAASTGTRPTGSPVYTTSQAGYVTGGRYFRFINTTVRVPSLQQQAGTNGSAELVLGGPGGPPVTLRVAAGGGPGSISYAWRSGMQWQTGYLSKVAPAPGELLTLSIYYDQRGQVTFTAANPAGHESQAAVVGVVPRFYTAAEVAGVINNGTVVPPTHDVQLWAFSDTHVTTYAGLRGTLLGPWTTSQVIDTRTGTAAGAVVMNAPVLWNSGQNFGVWLRPTA